MIHADVVVIGAGLAGQAVAFEVRRQEPQAAVLIIDKAKLPGSGLSGRLSGLLRLVFQSPVLGGLALASRSFYREAAENEFFGYVEHDAFLSTTTPAGGEELTTLAGALSRLGLAAGEGAEGAAGLPQSALDRTLAAAGVAGRRRLHLPLGAAAVPAVDLLDLFWLANHRRGVRYRLEEPVLDIEVRRGAVRGLATARERVATERLVLAAGTGSRELAELLGLVLPVELWRVQLAELAPSQNEEWPGEPEFCLDLDQGVWLHQTGCGLCVGRRMPVLRSRRAPGDGPVAVPAPAGTHWDWPENAGETDPPMLDWQHFGAMLQSAAARWPGLGEAVVTREWALHYAMTPDHLPLVGPLPQVEGLYAAAGFNGYGASLLPAAAAGLARQLAGEAAPALKAVAPGRFGELGIRHGALERTWVGMRAAAGGTGERLIL